MSYAFNRFGDALMARAYDALREAKQRCHNPNDRDYQRYGGRGLEVCPEWRGKDGFAHFVFDLGLPPTPKHTLDRVDNDGGYCPWNCRWATRKEQSNNRSNTIHLAHDGQTLPLTEWADRVGIKASVVRWRIAAGWSAEKAITTPVRPRKRGEPK